MARLIRETILIIDDERIVREIFITAFFDEYKIIHVTDPQEGLSILNRPNDIDLVVLDVMMPGMKGTEVLRQIKKMDPSYKVVMLTGYSSKEVAIEALRLHADDFIEKPFDIDEVKRVFERLLNSKKYLGSEENLTNIEKKIMQAEKLIKRNYNKMISLSDISRELFLSPKYFCRVFKQKTGKSFSAYKLKLRIERAKDLLKQRNYTISQIAYQVGYQNPDAFMKMFKKNTHSTPTEFRQQQDSSLRKR